MILPGAPKQPQTSTPRYTPSNPDPSPPQDGFSLSGAIVGGAVAAAGASRLLVTQGPALVGHSLRTTWKSLSLSPGLKVVQLATLAHTLPFAPVLVPLMAFVEGARQGAQAPDAGGAADVARDRVQQWESQADSSKAWLQRVADKPFEPDDHQGYPFVSLGDVIRRPKESWNLLRSW